MSSKGAAASTSAAAASAGTPRYQKKTQLEHILLRPDTYIGSVEAELEPYWVLDHGRFVYRKANIVPGLFKIFDEILVNAADNKQRDAGKTIMHKLEVTIDAVNGSIQVSNDGAGISTKKHDEYPIHIPQLIFGELLTSSNYDDDVKQTVGGRNGYGAKLANVFATRFTIDIYNAAEKASYSQTWTRNMTTCAPPLIKSYAGAKNSTRITFWPELKRFGMERLDGDILALMHKRVYDIAGTTPTSLKVFLDGKQVPVHDFKDFMAFYLGVTASSSSSSSSSSSGAAAAAAAAGAVEAVHPTSITVPHVMGDIDRDRWMLCVSISPSESFTHASFVNNISTSRGGTHVNLTQDLVTKAILELISKHRGASKSAKELVALDIKRQLFILCNTLVVNPTFDSQTKVNLTTKRADLDQVLDREKKLIKSKIALPEKFIKQLKASGIVEAIIERATMKADKKLGKTDGKKSIKRLTGIPKLEDANMAGTKDSHLCDSAKALAMSGLSVVGRDHYGVFPLKGKMLNVREASASQLLANSEVTALKKILGLQAGAVYKDNRSLRYGRVMIMADSDHDGSHIKGLVINMFAHCWPSLLHLPTFLCEFITPIIKARRGISATGASSANAREHAFYTQADFERWRQANNNAKGWNIKYYKGLGTSTANEAKAYFGNIDHHRIEFCSDPRADESLNLAFGGKMADQRKEWLGRYTIQLDDVNGGGGGGEGGAAAAAAGSSAAAASSTTDDRITRNRRISYSDFVDKELIVFSAASNVRAIPSMVDGLKPSQRKILFGAFKRNLKREIKVAQLAGYIGENVAYHHGEVSLCSTIVGLAQNFVSSNNIPLLLPLGQFGTRLQGGKNAAAARYIFTTLNPVTRSIFKCEDDATLRYLIDDGQSIEPEWYVPVLPMVLINGSSGIGTGWSSDVPQYEPRTIVAHLRRMIDIHEEKADLGTSDRQLLDGAFVREIPTLVPWFKGFTGEITPCDGMSDRFINCGVIERMPNGSSIHISELPVYEWTMNYKTMLEAMIVSGEILEFKEYHTDTRVSFLVDMTRDQLAQYEAEGLYKKFKLMSSIATTNMVLFDRHGKLKRYETANQVLIDFYFVRWDFYVKRKEALLATKRMTVETLVNIVRFIRGVCGLDVAQAGGERIVVTNRPRADIIAQLDRLKFLRIARRKRDPMEDEDDEEESDDGIMAEEKKGASIKQKDPEKTFDYLMGMNLWSLTKEKAASTQTKLDTERAELNELEARTLFTMWRADLDDFLRALDARERLEDKINADADEKVRRDRATKAVGTKNKAAIAAAAAAMCIKGTRIAPDAPPKHVVKKTATRKRPHSATADSTSSHLQPIVEDTLCDDDIAGDDDLILLDGPPCSAVASSTAAPCTPSVAKRPKSAHQGDIRHMFSK